MNKAWPYLIGIVVVWLSFLAGVFFEKHIQKTVYEQVVVRVKTLEKQRDSLFAEIDKLDEQVLVLQDSLSKNKQQVVVIKEKINEKVDSVRVLPLDSAIEFFSNEISKEASSGRGYSSCGDSLSTFSYEWNNSGTEFL